MDAWDRLRGHETVVTVAQCVREALSGIPGTPGRVQVTEDHLGAPLEVVGVTDRDRAQLAVSCDGAAGLDAGERDLLAHAFARVTPAASPVAGFVILSADQAAVRAAMSLQLGDQVVSLEEVLADAGIRVQGRLKGHYTRRKLSDWRTRYELDML